VHADTNEDAAAAAAAVCAEGEDALSVVENVMSRELKPELDMSMLAAMAPTMAFV
jgi:hypothetical protein